MNRASQASASCLLTNLVLGAALCVSGCSDGEPPMAAPVATYHRDIKPLMDRYCTGCHRAGDIAPFSLTDYDSVNRYAPIIKTAVESGRMPPWMPADDGPELRYSRKMRAQDRQLLLGWVADGARAGDAASPPRTDIPPAEQEPPSRPDLLIQAPQPYLPDTSMADDYRCFVSDPKLTRDRFIVAGQALPDNRAIAHHMSLYLISPAQAAKVRAMDAGTGYPCIAGPGEGVAGGLVLAWAPGGTGMRTPEGTAFRVPTGAVFVMQMHYSVVAGNGQPDRTSVALELGDAPPARELMSMFAVKHDLSIKAGDANWKESATYTVDRLGAARGDVVLYSLFPHMHLLGRRIALSVVGGTKLIEIPRWDFHWQNAYSFAAPITLHPTDVVRLECDYDNSYANQPVVGGQQQPPREVHWGESTLDEMCAIVLTAAPAGSSAARRTDGAQGGR